VAQLDKIVVAKVGRCRQKFESLIAVGVACTTQCPYCIEVHAKAAKAAGATREELVESGVCGCCLARWRCSNARRDGSEIFRRIEVTMNDILIKRFESPDETRVFEKGKFEIVNIGGLMIGRANMNQDGNGLNMLLRLLALIDVKLSMSDLLSRVMPWLR
jgi:AhpD family alkylhydroperoxidase